MIVKGTYFLAEKDRMEGWAGLGEKETGGREAKGKGMVTPPLSEIKNKA